MVIGWKIPALAIYHKDDIIFKSEATHCTITNVQLHTLSDMLVSVYTLRGGPTSVCLWNKLHTCHVILP